jgi:hypothetical protein
MNDVSYTAENLEMRVKCSEGTLQVVLGHLKILKPNISVKPSNT